MKLSSERRNFLKLGAGTAGALALFHPVTRVLAASCGLTPPQTSGPFYPGESRFRAENDLTVVPGRATRAKGQVIYIRGRVLDQNCRPVEGANVEIWQACATGRYNHDRDPNPAALDPNFKFWGEDFTDASGEYEFKTIIPGSYPADQDWRRPPHIHFKVSRLGYRELITQMYFKDDPLNGVDLILQQLDPAERSSVIVDFRPSPEGLEPGSLLGTFDITLRSVR